MLIVGESKRFEGVYIAHWEIPRCELTQKRRWWFPRVERCALEPRAGIGTGARMLCGTQPLYWPDHPVGKIVDMSFTATVLARGSFGHMGWCRWRLRVEEWHSISDLTVRAALPTARIV